MAAVRMDLKLSSQLPEILSAVIWSEDGKNFRHLCALLIIVATAVLLKVSGKIPKQLKWELWDIVHVVV